MIRCRVCSDESSLAYFVVQFILMVGAIVTDDRVYEN